MLIIHSHKKSYWSLNLIATCILVLIPILISYYVNSNTENWISFCNDYLGAIFGAIVSGLIALYATHQQIKANRLDNFNNEINFNNYKKLNNLLNDAFKEINLILNLDSNITRLIKNKPAIESHAAENKVLKSLSFYNKIFPNILNFYNSYIMKLKSITGNSLNMSKPIKDLKAFEHVIKNRTSRGHNTIYNDIDIISQLNKGIRNTYSDNNTNGTFNHVLHRKEFPYFNPAKSIKKENNYLNSLRKKIKKLLELLTKMTNDIKYTRDKNVEALRKR